MESHLNECSVIENSNISKANRAFWLKFYGINCLSPLAQIKDFPLTSNLVMDPMHILVLYIHYGKLPTNYLQTSRHSIPLKILLSSS